MPWTSPLAPGRNRPFVFASAFVVLLVTALLAWPWRLRSPLRRPHGQHPPAAAQHVPYAPPAAPPVPCYLPNMLGNLDPLTIDPVYLDATDYPQPFGGSHRALGLAQTWLSARERYGPYGLGEDDPGYGRTRVRWEDLSWGDLQDRCLSLNRHRHRYRKPFKFRSKPRLRLRSATLPQALAHVSAANPVPRDKVSFGRTAIVLRSWETYDYKAEDYYNLRSLITEAALESGASYAVFILVDIKDRGLRIHENRAAYDKRLRGCVPAEFRDITVLFDGSVLESWYSKVGESGNRFQDYQPLQLFAQFFPQFDHYWQLEMDTRILGHAGEFLNSLSKFATASPRKQSRERASFTFFEKLYTSYANLSSMVDASLQGGGLWGPQEIAEVEPIGPTPPTASPEDDDFAWGVGEEADVISLAPCQDVLLAEAWPFKDWLRNLPASVPRTACPPAQGRASWNLLNAIHSAQANTGLAVPSEATPASFAQWHGLKLAYAPHPVYQAPAHDARAMEAFWNGGPPGAFRNGMARGDAYAAPPEHDLRATLTWSWTSHANDAVMDAWLADDVRAELPAILRVCDGHVVVPNMALHPRKTNENP